MDARTSKLRESLALLRGGKARVLWHTLRRRLSSEDQVVGLRRDLALPFETPPAKVPLRVRRATEADRRALSTWEPGESAEDAHEQTTRARLLASGLGTCYAAVDDGEHLCYVQWLFGPEENAQVQRYFGGAFPVLAPDEVLLEAAFTFASRRGLRVMPCAMAQVAEEGRRRGARWALTFVSVDNAPSLKGCERAGFTPYVLRRTRWRLFRRRHHFEPLPAAPAPATREPPRGREGPAPAARPVEAHP